MGNNTVMKHIQRLCKMVTQAYKMEWIDKDPFIKFKPHYIRKEREFLREDELQSIIEKNFEFERLELVKDLFIFSCYTGLAYIDVMKLNEDHIVVPKYKHNKTGKNNINSINKNFKNSDFNNSENQSKQNRSVPNMDNLKVSNDKDYNEPL